MRFRRGLCGERKQRMMSSLPFHTSDHLRKLEDVQRSVVVGVKQIVHHLRALLGDSRSHDAPKRGAAQSVCFCKAFVAGQSKKMSLTGKSHTFRSAERSLSEGLEEELITQSRYLESRRLSFRHKHRQSPFRLCREEELKRQR